MASSMRHNQSLAGDADKENDPFVGSNQPHLRYSGFDSKLFEFGTASSPRQAKRALESHLAETERRMAEAGKLGTALVQQQKELRDRLAEVETQEPEGQLSGELRQKLSEIEREYNDVARQTARAFLPKGRVPSNEAAAGSPYVPEGKDKRRSVSPSKFESQATGSPTKLSVPNRKLRNQPANRVHDIEFAAEISTSLIAQVRNLQALLSEKDDDLRDATNDRSRLEIDAESLQQRLKQLDESEHRYKDENWTLETQVQELIAAQKEAAEREKRLTQSFNVLESERTKTQRELDEVKVSHAKLSEDHAAAMKLHDIELGTAKRSIATTENERHALHRKVDDLTSQNQELARAFSSSQRAKMLEREGILGMNDDDFENAADGNTPDHSPPMSPMKGTTPRHSMLESETLKTSLQHAQRTIQSQRNQLHREKTEKLEMKRMLQDARDDVERLRDDAGTTTTRKPKKTDTKDGRKYSKLLMGSTRTSREDIYHDDHEWEDQEEQSPRLFGSPSSFPGNPSPLREEGSTDQFDTANENSDAFETAEERGTETDDFQTGAEEFSGGESEATETDSPSKGLQRIRSNVTAVNFRGHRSRESFDSTASTSNDEDSSGDAGVPTSAPPKMRLRVSRGGLRRSRQGSEEPAAIGSPTSDSSTAGTPRKGGQSLFAELGDFDVSGESSCEGTPSRTLFAPPESSSSVPGLRSNPSIQKFGMVNSPAMMDPSKSGADNNVSSLGNAVVLRPQMVDSSTMTDQLDGHESMVSLAGAHFSENTDVNQTKRTSSYSDSAAQYDLEPEVSVPELEFTSLESQNVAPVQATPPALSLSSIQREELEPKIEPIVPPVLSISGISAEVLDPKAEPEPTPVSLSISGISAEVLDPKAEPEPTPAPLSISGISAEVVDPKAEPEPTPAPLSMSGISAEVLDPKAEPEPTPAPLSMSGIHSEALNPKAEPEPTPAPLSMSGIHSEALDPKAEPEPTPAPLSMSGIHSEALDPRAEPEVVPARPELTVSRMHTQVLEPDDTPLDTFAAALGLSGAALGLSGAALGLSGHVSRAADEAVPAPAPESTHASIDSRSVEPVSEPDVAPPAPALSMATIHSETVEPKEVEPEAVPELSMTTIYAQDLEPVATPEVVPDLGMASISSQSWEPVTEPEVVPELSMAGISSQGYEPVAEEVISPELRMANISSQVLEPVSEPEPPAPEQPALNFSTVFSEDIHPVEEAKPEPPPLTTSSIRSEAVAPVKPASLVKSRPDFGFTSIQSLETHPVASRSPRRDAFIIPQDPESPFDEIPKPRSGFVRGSVLGWDRARSPTPPLIAEDETRQSPRQSPQPETPESQRPLRAMSANTNERQRKPRNVMLDSGAQTALTSDVLDQMIQPRESQPAFGYERQESAGSGIEASGLRMRRDSVESTGSVVRHRSRGVDAPINNYRPTSSSSSKAPMEDLPPLPSTYKETIEAARTRSSHGGQGSMGPPLWPASATRPNRPMTPGDSKPSSSLGEPTPRAPRASTAPPFKGAQPPNPHFMSEQSSVTSFASELDNRFNTPAAGAGMLPGGFGPDTDPRMIQAITQTMIGEYLWKYTRKAGRGEMSENRHRRYFWVHPYTRTLYWSDRDPTTAGQKSELRAKSIPIEAVRVVTDDNPMPPGLPRKSLIVISPGRTVKFTATTSQRHETWLNALSYLLLRTNEEGQADTESMVGGITREDVDEFNPQSGHRQVRAPSRNAHRPSLSSFPSRNESPVMDMSMNIPTLTKRSAPKPQRPTGGTLTRLSGYWKPGQAFGSLRSSRRAAVTPDMYENHEVHDSAEDVRAMITRQDREADRLENVRACCDGKHDVGTLPRSKRNQSRLSHAHPVQPGSRSATPMSSLRTRV